MSNYPSPLITDRWAETETRLARLEALLGSGILGTDQTIKACHDRLDALLGAGVATANLANGIAIGTNVILAVIRKTGIADNAVTPIFSVTTTNESGSADGGAYICRVQTTVTHLATPTSTNASVEYNDATMSVVNKNDGTKASATQELHETNAVSTSALTREVGAVTPSEADTSSYQTDFRLQIDLTGSDPQTAEAVCFITLIWGGYTTAPVIAAL